MRIRLIIVMLVFLLVSCGDTDNTIRIKGSDTEVNLAVLLAESFHGQNNKLLVSVTGGGSGLGIASLLNGNADIANSSRRIKENERALFKAKGIQIDSFIFAQDAIAFVVSDKNPIDSISIENLSEILSGKQGSWFFLTSAYLPITIYGRQGNSGTYEYIRNILKIRFSPLAKQMNGNAQILESIKMDNSGIGYVGAGYILGNNLNGLKVLRIYSLNNRAVSPLETKSISSGKYYFQRPLYQYFRTKDYPKVKPFLDFERGQVGTDLIRASGYYPIRYQ